MAEKIVFFIFSITIFAAFIWNIVDPRGSMLFGKRWMYEEEPEFSEDLLMIRKIVSVIGFVIYLLIFLIVIFD